MLKKSALTWKPATCSGCSTPERLASHHSIAESPSIVRVSRRQSRKSAAVTDSRSKSPCCGSLEATMTSRSTPGNRNGRRTSASRMAKLVLLVASAKASVSTMTALVAGRRSSVRAACRRSRRKPARQLAAACASGGVQPAERRDRGRSRWLTERAPIESACRQYHRRAGPSPRFCTMTRNSSRRSPRMLSRHASSATVSARTRSASAGGSRFMTDRAARRGPARGWQMRRVSPWWP